LSFGTRIFVFCNDSCTNLWSGYNPCKLVTMYKLRIKYLFCCIHLYVYTVLMNRRLSVTLE
jgi:hypothetical protein